MAGGGRELRFKLYYESACVGDVDDPIDHQGTWSGRFRARIPKERAEIGEIIGRFITFCERWHERLKAGENPDPSEFDAFREVIESCNWEVEDGKGIRTPIDGAPVFIAGEISWSLLGRRSPSS
jgi:hypothetical protein